MSFIDVLLPEYDRETGTTRRMLERIPESAFAWAPHPTSTPLGDLATHLTEIPRWVDLIMTHESYDLSADSREPRAHPESTAEILTRFDTNVAQARALLVDAIDGTLTQPWTLARGRQVLFTMPKIGMLRYFVFNHLVHHRGQLSVYLRMHGVPIPAIYGPPTDEDALR